MEYLYTAGNQLIGAERASFLSVSGGNHDGNIVLNPNMMNTPLFTVEH